MENLKVTIIDDNSKRLSSFSNITIENFTIEPKSSIKIDGEIFQDSFEQIKPADLVPVKNILFIHSGNKYWKEFVQYNQKINTKVLIIVYTGGKEINGKDCFANNPLIIFKSQVKDSSDLNLIPALNYYAKNPRDVEGFFNAIQKFNPKLEVALEYLHQLMVNGTGNSDTLQNAGFDFSKVCTQGKAAEITLGKLVRNGNIEPLRDGLLEQAEL